MIATRLCFATLIFVCLFGSGCSTSERVLVEGPPAYQPSPSPEPAQLPKLPPKLNEVQDALKRVFKDAAVIDSGHQPNFVAGDFNGDHSQDIAVVVKPAPGKLQELNPEFPSWLLRDPFAPRKPGMQPLRVEENETLLAVIHGYGPEDWRDPQATQTFLLKNAVGSNLQVHNGKDFEAANRVKKIPRLRGDLIGEVLRGTSGYLYYAEATYAWYDPKTFKGEPERRLVHSGFVPKAQQ